MTDELAARRAQRAADSATGVPIAGLLDSFRHHIENERMLSARTVEVYERTGTQLIAFLSRRGYPLDTEGVDGPHLREFLAEEVARTSAVSAHQHYRNLNVMWKWFIREGERQAPNPMLRVDPPKVTEKIKEILAEDQLSALIRGCEGNEFEQRRDMAIIRIFVDTGVRVSGLANVMVNRPKHEPASDISLGRKQIRVILKGGDEHMIPLGRKATAALDRYLRSRARHKESASDWLWLGMQGRNPSHFGSAGIQDMLERRGKLIGIARLTPHYFRRTAAHDMLDSGMSESQVMEVAGWKTSAMVRKYAGALAAQRAREAHAKHSPGDRF